MKARHVLCFFLIAFFLPSIPTQAEGPSVGSVTMRSCRILAGAHPGLNSYGAAGGESRLIIDNWNPAGCGFTDNAVMNLSRPTYVESVQLWYNWAAGETSLPYTLTAGGRVLRQGQLRRGSCDPYQTAWCEATDMLGMNLAPGSYTFATARRRVCQNSGSNGLGFIHVRGRFVRPEEVSGSPEGTPEVRPQPTPGGGRGEGRIIIDNWNTAGCGFTDNAVMNLSRPTHVESVHLWYNWAAGESSLPYALSGGGRVLRNGQFRRGSCDPYQTAWCEATDMLGMNLAPGSYTFTTARRRVCQNSGSNGMGFIRVTARTGRAGPGEYPGQETIQPSQPATPEFTAGPATNLALGKPTQQSSTYSGDFPASNGVDGRKDDGSMFHTNNERNPWWQVDLQGNYALSYIMLYNRTGCCAERERTVQVLLSQNGSNWQRIYSHNGTDFRELRVEASGRRARYVRVQLAEQNYFHLQEVEVYGVPAARTAAQPFGTQPSQFATPELAAGPTTNLALGKPAQQSSTYSGDFPASSGVDGRKDDGSMFHTNNERNPWWQVDLEGNYALSYIMLYNRTGCCAERERTVQVLLSQNGSNWQRIYSHNGTDFRELRVEASGRRARYVRVQLAEQNYFHLQEVEVYGAR